MIQSLNNQPQKDRQPVLKDAATPTGSGPHGQTRWNETPPSSSLPPLLFLPFFERTARHCLRIMRLSKSPLFGNSWGAVVKQAFLTVLCQSCWKSTWKSISCIEFPFMITQRERIAAEPFKKVGETCGHSIVLTKQSRPSIQI